MRCCHTVLAQLRIECSGSRANLWTNVREGGGDSCLLLKAHSSCSPRTCSPGPLRGVCEPTGKYFGDWIGDNIDGKVPECGGVIWYLPSSPALSCTPSPPSLSDSHTSASCSSSLCAELFALGPWHAQRLPAVFLFASPIPPCEIAGFLSF